MSKLSAIEKIMVLAIIVLLVGFASRKIDNASSKAAITPSQPAKSEMLDLGVTFQNFRDAYNKVAEFYEVYPISPGHLHWEETETDSTFYYYFGNTVVLFGKMDRATGVLKTVAVGCDPDKGVSEKDVIERAAVIYLFVIKALNPKLTNEQSENVVRKLSTNLRNYAVLEGNVRYRSRIYDEKLLLSAEGKDFR